MQPAETFSLGDYLRDAMDARGWVFFDLQHHSGLNPDRLKKILRGKNAWKEEMVALATALGVEPALLFRLQGAHIRGCWATDLILGKE